MATYVDAYMQDLPKLSLFCSIMLESPDLVFIYDIIVTVVVLLVLVHVYYPPIAN